MIKLKKYTWEGSVYDSMHLCVLMDNDYIKNRVDCWKRGLASCDVVLHAFICL